MKRLLIIASILILLGIGAWFFLARDNSNSIGQTLTNILPFGSGEGTVPSTTGTSTEPGATNPVTGTRSHLFKVSDVPIAGAVSLIKSGNLVVRYVERATGHIVDVDPVSLVKTKIVNTTVPKVYEAIFRPSGTAVIFRTLRIDNETIDSNSITLIPPAGTSTSDLYTTKSFGLPANIASLSTGSTTIFYALKNLPQVYSALFDGTKPSAIFSSSFNQWKIDAAGDSKMVLTAAASSETDGYSYSLDARTSAFSKLLGPLTALIVTPNANLTRIAYSFNTGDRTVLASTNLTTGTIYNIRPVTLAEKCIWSIQKRSTLYCAAPAEGIGNGEPDLWYKGMTHFTDRIWRFDTDTDFSDVLSDPKKDFNISIDAENLFLSPKEEYLFFQNKNDLTLWALKLN
jgi:hypothetical protein